MYTKVNPVEAKKIIDSENDIYIIDVREEDELIEGYIENSILIPLDSLANNINSVVTDKNSKILVYCRSGRRSAIAAEILSNLGYSNIIDIGGIIDWPFEIVY